MVLSSGLRTALTLKKQSTQQTTDNNLPSSSGLDDSLPLIEGVTVPPPSSLKQARLISHLDFDLMSLVNGIDGNTPRM